MLYIKDGKLKDASEIVVIVGDFQVINPTKEQILADGWEEYTPPVVDEVESAKRTKIADINTYDKSDSVNSFTLNGTAVWLDKDTRVGLMNSVTIEKAAGRQETTLWFPIGGTPQKIVINVDKAIQMLGALELYALACYNVTSEHIANVSSLTNVDDIIAYDYKVGYPEKLNLSTI